MWFCEIWFRVVRKLITWRTPGVLSFEPSRNSSEFCQEIRGENPRVAVLRDDCEFYPTAELPVAGPVFSEELPGRLVSVISISSNQGLLLLGGTSERLLTPGTAFSGLPGVLAGCSLAVIPGSDRRRALLTNAALHVGGDLCCLSCTHLPWAQLAPVSSETANRAFVKEMIQCIVCLMQQVYFQTHL